MKKILLLAVLIMTTTFVAQEKHLYILAGGGIQGLGKQTRTVTQATSDITTQSKMNIDFKPTSQIILGFGYCFQEYLNVEVLYGNKKLIENVQKYLNDQFEGNLSISGYSISMLLKGRYSIFAYFNAYIGIGYEYNSLKGIYWYVIKSNSQENNTYEYSKGFSGSGLNVKIGLDMEVFKNIVIFSESGINLFQKEIDGPTSNYEWLQGDAHNQQPITPLGNITNDYTLNDIYISAGIQYYIF